MDHTHGGFISTTTHNDVTICTYVYRWYLHVHTGRVFCAAGKLVTAPLLRDWGLANRTVGGGLRARGEGGGVLVREFNTTRAWGMWEVRDG